MEKLINWLVVLALLLILSRFVTQTYARTLTNSNSANGDQSAFLQLGLDLREKGTVTDGTRNPLYAAFLAVIARREWAYFSQAKLLSMGFGVLAIIALYLLGQRYFNRFTGLASAYLLSINTEFIGHSATALTESLLVLTFILSWFAMIKALDRPDKQLYWAAAGVLAGFAYLAKGSGQLLVLAFLISALLIYRRRLWQTKGLWIFLVSYGLIASPLWVYNTIRFGSPTFNYPITHQMWLEEWSDWHPEARDNLPTVFSYLQTHSVSEIVSREWSGMKALRNIGVKTLWPTRTVAVDEFLLSPLSTYVLALLALLPLIFWRATRHYIQQQRSAVYLTVLTLIIFYLLFAWYTSIVALGQRFLLPIISLIFILATHSLSLLWLKLAQHGLWTKRLLVLASASALIYQGYWALNTNIEPTRRFFTHNLFEQDRQFNADAATPLEWLTQESPQARVVAWGPSGNSLPAWAYSDRLNFKPYPPQADTISQLTQLLVRRNVDFVIVNPEMVARYRELLHPHFPSDSSRIEVTGIPAGWALTYAYRDMPCNWCIFRLLPGNPPQHKVNYQVGQAIRLVGYDLARSQLRAGEMVYLTLHWNADARMDQDYTVFTQLLGPDFQLHGQLDRQPLNNLWPTSRWQPGDQLADRYEIPIDAAAPVGKYQILVGMYNLQTGQRQPISQHGRPVPDNAIYLTTLRLTLEPAHKSTAGSTARHPFLPLDFTRLVRFDQWW